ncbi:hypothetical protein G8759_20145 [Spirosoma aureum]|uniref:Uncharacterized protein n=1 Tax=Spirosoma aureum TaxID=2692134 RepID=A0A6G9AR06_9BACT|nr:hypothetical protein [Spirosoma aureum]QIP14764.1 hypothetical protein G8759_20145 [Spirosoma aureum]
MSEYHKPSLPQSFDSWLVEVVDELRELHHTDPLSQQECDWLYNVWENYDLSIAEAAQSFINENPV